MAPRIENNVPTTDQWIKFGKNFGLPIIILGGMVYYLMTTVENQKIESQENKTYVQTKMAEMTKTTAIALANSTTAIESNTRVLEKQFEINHMIASSVVRQETTLDSIDDTIKETCAVNKDTQDFLKTFTERVSQEHQEQLDKTKEILTRIK